MKRLFVLSLLAAASALILIGLTRTALPRRDISYSNRIAPPVIRVQVAKTACDQLPFLCCPLSFRFDHTLMEKTRTGGRRGACPVPWGEPVTGGKAPSPALT